MRARNEYSTHNIIFLSWDLKLTAINLKWSAWAHRDLIIEHCSQSVRVEVRSPIVRYCGDHESVPMATFLVWASIRWPSSHHSSWMRVQQHMDPGSCCFSSCWQKDNRERHEKKDMMNVSMTELCMNFGKWEQVRSEQARGMACQGTLRWIKEYWERRRDRPARRAANARNVSNCIMIIVWMYCMIITFKAASSFVSSSPTRQNGGQEAEIVSYFASLARASVDNVAYFSP
jgi:hypothetical protein